ncbi:MAG TPA: L-serine ammonia-lyase, iron-sulfur-dependent subunit beta [Rectinemataceae bacterium]|nr:L-serine ammonia-lyase, iron-sulfur-dependent subunit beta [Rectinemataceae bacterium]
MSEGTTGILDLFGPVMIGPSSSHTAGVARIAFLVRKILPGRIDRARVSFYGSLARTYRGHGSDKAAIAGLLGMLPEDERLAFAPELARREGLEVEIVPVLEGPPRYHPNTAVFELWSGDRHLRVRAASIGGGEIRLQSIDGFEADLDGNLDAILVLHHDEPGVVARVAAVLAARGFNIATVVSHRKDKGDEALLVVEVDGVVPTGVADELRGVRGAREVVYVPSIKS